MTTINQKKIDVLRSKCWETYAEYIEAVREKDPFAVTVMSAEAIAKAAEIVSARVNAEIAPEPEET